MSMKTITKEELATILEKHKHWLNKDVDGWVLMHADLENTDLKDVDLRNANLKGADLRGADLRGADLTGANLSSAFLNAANLSDADLTDADVSCAVLINTNLRGANLSNTNFTDTDLKYVDLRGVNLYIPMACPDTGSFIGWKMALDENDNKVIIKLLIPKNARRSSATGRKCRCDKAVVLDIEGADVAYSEYDHDFVYRKGETVSVDNFDDNRFNECAPGIHFFMNVEEAMRYRKN